MPKFFATLSGRRLRVAISLACGAGFTLFGYDQGVFGGILTNQAFKSTFENPDATLQSQMVSTYYLGAVFGALGSNYSGDKLGRKRSILFGCIWLTIGGALQASAFGFPQMLVGRIIAGVGTGINTTAIPLWQVETSESSQRGLLVAFELVLVVFAQVIAAFINFGFSYKPEASVSWRFPLAMQCFFSLMTLVAVLPLPESPRFLLMKGHREDAFQIFARLSEDQRTGEETQQAFEVLSDSLQAELESQKVGLREILSNGPSQTLRRILLGCGTAMMQQATGVNVVTNYLPIILTASVGLSEKLALALTAVNSVNLTLWGVLAMFIIDRVGRRTIMLWCAAGQAICFTLITIGIRFGDGLSVMAIVFIYIFGGFYSNGFLAIPWLYPAEVNSQRMRNRGASISTTVNWLCVYVVVLATPIGLQDIGWAFFLIFAVFNAVFLPIIFIFYVETAKLSLEQIDRLFEIKHAGGVKMSLRQARRLAIEETAAQASDADSPKPDSIQIEVLDYGGNTVHGDSSTDKGNAHDMVSVPEKWVKRVFGCA